MSVSLSLDTPATITLGEPIMLHYRVTNNLPDQKLATHMGVYGTDWYTMTLRDENGKSATSIPDLRPTVLWGLHQEQNMFIGLAGHTEGYTVVTQFFAVTHPGKYTLRVHVQLPYAAAPATAEGLADPLTKASGTVFTDDYTFPLTMTPPDSDRLRKTAEALRKEIAQKEYGLRLKPLVSALFSMPEAQARPSWEALVNNPRMSAELYADALKGLRSAGAADILAGMLSNPSLNRDELAAIGTDLNEMYNNADAPVRAHIKDLAAQRGLTLPEKIDIPQASD